MDEETGLLLQLNLHLHAMHASLAPHACDVAGACKQMHDEFLADRESHTQSCRGVLERRFDSEHETWEAEDDAVRV